MIFLSCFDYLGSCVFCAFLHLALLDFNKINYSAQFFFDVD